jgi:ATP/maltotriose-dependent transcriptional regulator MalT
MILALIPDVIKLPAAAVLGAGLMFFPAKWIGQSEGRQMAATAALANSVQVLRERNTIDEEVTASDAAALCGSYGLSDDEQAECVRRIQEADALAGHDGDDPAQGPAVCGPGSKPQ